MKNRVYLIMLFLLIGLGVFLVWQQAHAIPPACVYAEYWCTVQCWGEFSLDYCWEDGGQTYCWFYCVDFHRECGWTPPVYAMCEGPMK
jgi:hypothetical protein